MGIIASVGNMNLEVGEYGLKMARIDEEEAKVRTVVIIHFIMMNDCLFWKLKGGGKVRGGMGDARVSVGS